MGPLDEGRLYRERRPRTDAHADLIPQLSVPEGAEALRHMSAAGTRYGVVSAGAAGTSVPGPTR